VSRRAGRILFVGFFLAYALAVTWPGVLPFNRVRPFVLGLPFSFAWVALWIVLGLVVFLIVHRAEAAGTRKDVPAARPEER
jgi:TRAP-type C4-dicarboxylate transport system permease small subunit